MPTSQLASRSTIVVCGLAAVLLSACTAPGPESTPADPPPPAPPGFALPDASMLCTDLAEREQEMRTYTPSIGRVTLNGIVINWATNNNVDLIELARNRDAIDTALIEACPTVRDNVMSYLDIPSIASAIIGLPE
ncbi:hypothetical protein IEU95_14175 [Hoyosella rhizosphaerae]|uniref:Uncharacterized protein n=1 Tax=Hoyosella rhizosphaerae TaxID=1755582 RepID=A0A916UF80_9ACTN|nr:hypothetical protein [Hoyosella rhizosphaerae]MBN4927989.1 hypothetical protein [Hoyosella rhizosphaerae]GGC71486.1 hypothetical protein GCM10011410_25590 [Hoyosella rhizosphaerae]